MLIAHTRLNNNAIEEESQPVACSIASCNMSYRRKGWLSRHIAQCHQASEEASTPAPTPRTHTTENKIKMPTTTSEFKCPLCTKILPTRKRMSNHWYTNHRYSVLKGMHMNETTVGTTARSSESRLGLPDSGPQ